MSSSRSNWNVVIRVNQEPLAGSMEVVGLETLLGRYERIRSLRSDWVFRKTGVTSEEVFLYFSIDLEVWWFGSEVEGSLVYCYAFGDGFPPPERGWRVPIDGDPEIEGLRVTIEEGLPT